MTSCSIVPSWRSAAICTYLFDWPGTPACIHGEMSVPSPCVSSLVVLMGAKSLTTSAMTCGYRAPRSPSICQRFFQQDSKLFKHFNSKIVLFLHDMPFVIQTADGRFIVITDETQLYSFSVEHGFNDFKKKNLQFKKQLSKCRYNVKSGADGEISLDSILQNLCIYTGLLSHVSQYRSW